MSACEMSRETEELLERLEVIARGDAGLVMDAFRDAGPRLEDIVAHIVQSVPTHTGGEPR